MRQVRTLSGIWLAGSVVCAVVAGCGSESGGLDEGGLAESSHALAAAAPVPVPVAKAEPSKDIASLVACLNREVKGAGNIATAAEKCLPSNCTVQLTMSLLSAQPACTLSKDDFDNLTGAQKAQLNQCPGKIQLPRVLLTCEGGYMPSFALCPKGDGKGSFDSNRIEVGVLIDQNGDAMEMADITIPDGGLANDLTVNGVTSREGNDKGCNSNICHNSEGTSGDKLLSEILSPDRLIFQSGGGITPIDGLKAQTLGQVCACIDQAVAANIPPLDKPQAKVVAALCKALSKKYPDAPPPAPAPGGGAGGAGGKDDEDDSDVGGAILGTDAARTVVDVDVGVRAF
jgi:hypothetical protein